MSAAPSDDWIAVVERALDQVLAGSLARANAVAAIAAAVTKAHLDQTSAERTKAEGARLLLLWQAAGADRYAAGKVAARLSDCPSERQKIAQRIRDLRRKRK